MSDPLYCSFCRMSGVSAWHLKQHRDEQTQWVDSQTWQTFRATIWPASSEAADTEARAACDQFFGDRAYRITSIDVQEHRTVSGTVVGYEADVHAEQVPS